MAALILQENPLFTLRVVEGSVRPAGDQDGYSLDVEVTNHLPSVRIEPWDLLLTANKIHSH